MSNSEYYKIKRAKQDNNGVSNLIPFESDVRFNKVVLNLLKITVIFFFFFFNLIIALLKYYCCTKTKVILS
jgi:hypothetical protein